MESPMIKQIASSRRRPGMTRREYLDHHFRVHGAIADGAEDRDARPQKYTQTHIFDSVYGEHPSPVPNSNHAWMARDDVTELYFRDLDHVLANMASPYVHEKVAPDAPLFADFETATVLLAREHSVPLAGQSGEEGRGAADKQSPPRDVALFFIAAPDGSPDGASLHAELMPLLTSALEEIASDAVCGLLVNIGFASDKLDVTKYYGGKDMPRYAVVYKIVMQNAASVASLRKAQAVFAQRAAGLFDDSVSYTLFGREALILDTTKGIRFDPARQPLMPDLVGPSHLDG